MEIILHSLGLSSDLHKTCGITQSLVGFFFSVLTFAYNGFVPYMCMYKNVYYLFLHVCKETIIWIQHDISMQDASLASP